MLHSSNWLNGLNRTSNFGQFREFNLQTSCMLLQAKLQTFQNIILRDFLNLSGIQLPPIKTQSIGSAISTKNVKNDRSVVSVSRKSSCIFDS